MSIRRALLATAAALLALPAAAAGATPAVTTSLTPRAILFGDTVRARVDVIVDTHLDDPSTIALRTPLGGWTVLTPVASTTSSAGRLLRRTFVLTLACRAAACVTKGPQQQLRPPPAVVTVRQRDGRLVQVHASWPTVEVASRLPPGATTAAKPPFQLQTSPPPLRPRVSPRVTVDLLDALAVVLALVAAGIVAVEVRRRTTRPTPDVPEIERAVRLVREAERRPPPDRRRALALLARVAGGGGALATDAAVAAWSREPPSPDALDVLAGRAEKGEAER